MLAQLDYDIINNKNFDAFLEGLRYQKLKYYASDLQQRLDLKSVEELKDSVKRAMDICQTQNLDGDDHFKPIYRCEASQVIIDWKLSPLGYCLVMLNSNPRNKLVSRMQLKLVYSIINKEKAG